MKCEWEQLAQERATGAARDAALIELLHRIIAHGNFVSFPPSSSSAATKQKAPMIHNTSQMQHHIEALVASMQPVVAGRPGGGESNGGNNNESGMPRWPKEEVDALIRLRMEKDELCQDLGGKGQLWDDISAGMRNMGYHRSSKRCKEKWENINKYFKKVKESKKRCPQDAKTCPCFHQLEDIYRKRQQFTMSGSSSIAPGDTMVTVSEQAVLEQENHQCELQGNIGDDFGMMGNDRGGNSDAPSCNNGDTAMDTTVLDDNAINEEENPQRELEDKINNDLGMVDNTEGKNLDTPPSNGGDITMDIVVLDDRSINKVEDKINNDLGMVENIERKNLATPPSNGGDTTMDTVVLDDSSINKEENPQRELEVKIKNNLSIMGNGGGDNLLAPLRNGGDTPMDINVVDNMVKNKNPMREFEGKISNNCSMMDNGGGDNLHAPLSSDDMTGDTTVLDESTINIEENLLAPPCNVGNMAIDTAVLDDSAINEENPSCELESKISIDFNKMDNGEGENLLSQPSNGDDTAVDTTVLDESAINKDENHWRELEGNISNDFGMMGNKGGENLIAAPNDGGDTTIDTTVLDDNTANNEQNPLRGLEGKISTDFAMMINGGGENLLSAPRSGDDTIVDTSILDESAIKKEDPWRKLESNINNNFEMIANGGGENLLAAPSNGGDTAMDTVMLDDNAINHAENPWRKLKDNKISNDFELMGNGEGENLLVPPSNGDDTAMGTTVLDDIAINKDENPWCELEDNINNEFGMMDNDGGENLLAPPSNDSDTTMDTSVLDVNAINKEENPWHELEGKIQNDFDMMDNGGGENLLAPPNNSDDKGMDTTLLDDNSINKDYNPCHELESKVNNDFKMMDTSGWENLLAPPSNDDDTTMDAAVLDDNPINKKKEDIVITTEADMQPQQKDFTDREETGSDDIESNYIHEDHDDDDDSNDN